MGVSFKAAANCTNFMICIQVLSVMGVCGFNKVLRWTAGSCEIYAFVSTKSIQTEWWEMNFKDLRALTVALDVLTIYWNVGLCINHRSYFIVLFQCGLILI